MLLQVHLQVQYQSEVTEWQPGLWCHTQKHLKPKQKKTMSGKIRTTRWQIFWSGWKR